MTIEQIAKLIIDQLDSHGLSTSYLPSPDGDEQLAVTDKDGNELVVGVSNV